MTASDTAALRAWLAGLTEGATPGPWRWNGFSRHVYQNDPWRRALTPGRSDKSREAYPDDHDGGLLAAAPDLARHLSATLDRLEAVQADRDRLARILAVERGDESAAPDGWRCVGLPVWSRDDGSEVSGVPGAYDWAALADDLPFGARGTAPTALGAMEAADAARTGDDG